MRIGDVVMLTPARNGSFLFAKESVGAIGLVIGGPSHWNQWWVAFVNEDRYSGACVPFKNLHILDHLVEKAVLRRAEGQIKYEANLTAIHLRIMRKCLRDIEADRRKK